MPPRPVQQTYRPSYSSFPSSYSPYGSSIYGGYSPYSYGGGYGLGGYNRFLHNEEIVPSRFVQQAEESSRGAFQSIESIVQAFASVSMMMDATFSAVYNSFRAVLDVANHLTRLRAHLTRVLSAFALVRTLRYLYRRLQRLLGRRSESEVEDLWADSANDSLATSGAGMENQPVKSWPIFLFFAVVLGGPYLIWKLLSSSPDSEDNGNNEIFCLFILALFCNDSTIAIIIIIVQYNNCSKQTCVQPTNRLIALLIILQGKYPTNACNQSDFWILRNFITSYIIKSLPLYTMTTNFNTKRSM